MILIKIFQLGRELKAAKRKRNSLGFGRTLLKMAYKFTAQVA